MVSSGREPCRASYRGAIVSVLPYRQATLRLDERSIVAIRLVVEATGVAEVVTRTVTTPERGGDGSWRDWESSIGGR